MTEYKDPNGGSVELDEASIADLRLLSGITRTPTNELASAAIEQLRNALVPSTKHVATRGPRTQAKPKDDKA